MLIFGDGGEVNEKAVDSARQSVDYATLIFIDHAKIGFEKEKSIDHGLSALMLYDINHWGWRERFIF
jgi:hypothetical protein